MVDRDANSTGRRRLIILGSLWLFVVLVLVAFRSVVLPFAGAALIAYLVAPLVDRLTTLRLAQRPLPRWVAILLIYALFFVLVYLAILGLVPQLYRELARITRGLLDWLNALTPERIDQLSRAADAWFAQRGLPLELTAGNPDNPSAAGLSFDLQQLIHDGVARGTTAVRNNLAGIIGFSRSLVSGVLAFVFMLFFILMVAAYLSIDVRHVRSYVRGLIPPEYAEDVKVLATRIDRSLSGVVRGQVTICLVNGALTLIGLMLFGVKFAFILATLATLLSLIPIFGSIISSVPIVLIGLSQSWKTGLASLAWIIGIHALEAYFLNPKIMGSAARIHPIIVAFALIAGERTFGLVGALFAVPIAAIVVACFDFAARKAQGAAPEPYG